jgi:hypothetical protein
MPERVIGAALLLSLPACTGENTDDLYTAQIDEIFSEWDQPGSSGAAVVVIMDSEISAASQFC